ncbi:hypothetical protein ACFWJW_03640 [Streptomyces sp. NPDC127097]|uniref:hypothetical protein n=1 Tax=Streptomyces sp. NPDC127097 TaxID=3347136 RepID=UPI00366A2BD2
MRLFCREFADLLLHLTEWPQFSHIDPPRSADRTATPRFINGRGTLNTDTWRDAGWTVRTSNAGPADPPSRR